MMVRRVLHEIRIDKIAAVDQPCQAPATVTLMKRTFSEAERRRLADTGAALPDGSFPIETVADLHNAIRDLGRAVSYEAAKRHVIQRARAIGAVDQLPDSWAVQKAAPDFAKARAATLEAVSTLAKSRAAVTGETYERAFSSILMAEPELQRALQ